MNHVLDWVTQEVTSSVLMTRSEPFTVTNPEEGPNEMGLIL